MAEFLLTDGQRNSLESFMSAIRDRTTRDDDSSGFKLKYAVKMMFSFGVVMAKCGTDRETIREFMLEVYAITMCANMFVKDDPEAWENCKKFVREWDRISDERSGNENLTDDDLAFLRSEFPMFFEMAVDEGMMDNTKITMPFDISKLGAITDEESA